MRGSRRVLIQKTPTFDVEFLDKMFPGRCWCWQLADRDVHIKLGEEAKKWLTEKGYDKLYGARPMGRLIQEKIKQPLAEELLFGKLVHGGEVTVHLKDGALTFAIEPAAPKKPGKKKGGKAAPVEAG